MVVPLCAEAVLSFSSQFLSSCALLFSVSLSNLEFSCPFSLQTLKKWNLETVVSSKNYNIPYLPMYNMHFFPSERAPKVEIRIIYIYMESFVLDLYPSLACKQIREMCPYTII